MSERGGLDRAAPVLLLVVGLWMAFHPTLGSGFDRVQTDPGDTRLNHYFLESHWQWLSGAEGHGPFQAPMAHPAPSTLALGDYMLAYVPVYAPFRIVGLEPRASFQAWYVTMGALNFALFFLFLRRGLRFSSLASSFGAFLFAFAAMRVQKLGHQQLLPQLYVIVGVWAVVGVFRAIDSAREPGARATFERGAIAVFFAAWAAQFHGGFYNAFFWGFLAVLMASSALLLSETRRELLAFVWRRRIALATGALAALAVVAPLALEYAALAEDLGLRPVEDALRRRAHPGSWLLVHPTSWFYGWLGQAPGFADIPVQHERALGLGFVTTGVVACTAWWNRGRTGVRLLAVAWIGLVVFVTKLPFVPLGLEPWRLAYDWVPGAGGIRELARVGLFTLIPAAVALAAFVEGTRRGPRARAALAIAMACVLEQGLTTGSYDEDRSEEDVERIAERVDPHAEAFLVVSSGAGRPWYPGFQLDAMWASLESGKPTLNTFSGNAPPGYPFGLVVATPEQEARLQADLAAWAAAHGADPARFQVIRLP